MLKSFKYVCAKTPYIERFKHNYAYKNNCKIFKSIESYLNPPKLKHLSLVFCYFNVLIKFYKQSCTIFHVLKVPYYSIVCKNSQL